MLKSLWLCAATKRGLKMGSYSLDGSSIGCMGYTWLYHILIKTGDVIQCLQPNVRMRLDVHCKKPFRLDSLTCA